MSAIAVPTRADRSTVDTGDEDRFVFHDVSWDRYEEFLDWLGDRYLRVTYDDGTMEIMSPGVPHEIVKKSLGAIVEILLEELRLPSTSVGSMTMRRRDIKGGLEPDDCFYIANMAKVLGKRKLDLHVDPPPDLVIEVDVTSSVLDRLKLYATLGIPEVWRFDFDEHRLEFLKWNRAGRYVPVTQSVSLPGFDSATLGEWVDRSLDQDQTAWRIAFRAWVRRRLAQARKRGRTKNGA